uniref:Uncharacterized protein n=1 Tax=Biomphalaria glabrata TaxID=6526 RepID=A0A2C9KL84_BIOGL
HNTNNCGLSLAFDSSTSQLKVPGSKVQLPPIRSQSKQRKGATSKPKSTERVDKESTSVATLSVKNVSSATNAKSDALMFTRDELSFSFLKFLNTVDEIVFQLTRK